MKKAKLKPDSKSSLDEAKEYFGKVEWDGPRKFNVRADDVMRLVALIESLAARVERLEKIHVRRGPL